MINQKETDFWEPFFIPSPQPYSIK